MGLFWAAVFHDWHKFLPSEFFPYANYFGVKKENKSGKTGYYKPVNTGNDEFEIAWLSHIHRGKHHWQHWAIPTESGHRLYDIPDKYLLEMVCDWWGAGRAQGAKTSPLKWYEENKSKIVMTPSSEARLRAILDIVVPFAR
jgi:hypothetical protein